MDFEVPDERGKQPKGDSIVLSSSNDSSLTTSLPLSAILAEQSPEQVAISNDPGRFVCNYVYYKSLLHQKSKGSSLNSLFIHVPPYNPKDTITVDLVVKIVKQLITSVVCKACF